MRIVLLSLFGILVGCKNISWTKSPTKITTTYLEPSGKKINKLLLIGLGDSRSRIFFDDLAGAINLEFVKTAILTESLFVSESADLDTVDHNNYDALLIFAGKEDMKILSIMSPKLMAPGGRAYDYNMITTIKGNLGLLLYQPENTGMDLVWKGDLLVDVLMTSKQEYRQVARLICTELQKKKVVIK